MPTTLLKAAAIRALRTFLQAVIAAIPVGVGFEGIGWIPLASVAGTAALVSFAQGVLAGLPEATDADA